MSRTALPSIPTPGPPPPVPAPKPKKDYSLHIGERVRCENCSYWLIVPGQRQGLCNNFNPTGQGDVTQHTVADFGCNNFKALPVVVQAKSRTTD